MHRLFLLSGFLLALLFFFTHILWVHPYIHPLMNTLFYTFLLGIGALHITAVVVTHSHVLSTIIPILMLFASVTLFSGLPAYEYYIERPEREALLEDYLDETYPDRRFEIHDRMATNESMHLFYVQFDDEPDFYHAYHIHDAVASGDVPPSPSGGAGVPQ
ncbi:hypothetical protein [Alkalicoccus urumqiensis]|uniref:Uncharacterized protein n=1 Tax=Alkalicoccus urumqiensis TaxID=1548213 RepID=A0A2P6MJV3_ALKUR|nr:hypothetical protein [Alkalicoccus urumqiensis]PRO66535.1 hypothetical protein C6I21_04110 [Alkalicoccus urumqiensis]